MLDLPQKSLLQILKSFVEADVSTSIHLCSYRLKVALKITNVPITPTNSVSP